MAYYEYKVLPAPAKGTKARGVRQPVDRMALALTNAMNEMAMEGWEYVRAEALPSEERTGLTKRSMVTHNLLIFRREIFLEEEEPEVDDEVTDFEREEEPEEAFVDPEPAPQIQLSRARSARADRNDPPLTSRPVEDDHAAE